VFVLTFIGLLLPFLFQLALMHFSNACQVPKVTKRFRQLLMIENKGDKERGAGSPIALVAACGMTT
jgi:hypothetical protein